MTHRKSSAGRNELSGDGRRKSEMIGHKCIEKRDNGGRLARGRWIDPHCQRPLEEHVEPKFSSPGGISENNTGSGWGKKGTIARWAGKEIPKSNLEQCKLRVRHISEDNPDPRKSRRLQIRVSAVVRVTVDRILRKSRENSRNRYRRICILLVSLISRRGGWHSNISFDFELCKLTLPIFFKFPR